LAEGVDAKTRARATPALSALPALPAGQGGISAECAALLALAPSGASEPAEDAGLKPGAEAHRLLGAVSALPAVEGGKRYLRMEADYEAVFELPFELLYSTLLDFEAYPGFFGRVALMKRLSPPGMEGPIRFRQRTAVKVLWFGFASEYEFDAAASYLEGGRAGVIAFRSSSGDGALTDVSGGWYLEARGAGRCYVRYRLGSSTREDFSGQKGIMAGFMDADFRAVFRQLGAEAGRRARAGG